jgi:hypothetical protein
MGSIDAKTSHAEFATAQSPLEKGKKILSEGSTSEDVCMMAHPANTIMLGCDDVIM